MRELWGTFSVRDHMDRRAFVAEVILYDRLVIPCPPAAEPGEWKRWEEQEHWNPKRQAKFLEVLRGNDLVVEVPWDKPRRRLFQKKYTAAQAVDHETDGFALTAHDLLPYEELEKLRSMPVKPKTVAAYGSRAKLQREVPVRSVDEGELEDPEVRKQELAIVLGYKFLVPDATGIASDKEDLKILKRAVKVAARPKFRERRAAFNDWLDRAVAARYTDAEAFVEMKELLDAYNSEVKAAKIPTRVDQAFLVTGTGLAIAGHFFPPLWLGSVALAPARYVTMKVLPDQPFQNAPPAMFHEARRGLARRPLGR
jgi:hypothetical protein